MTRTHALFFNGNTHPVEDLERACGKFEGTVTEIFETLREAGFDEEGDEEEDWDEDQDANGW